MILAAALLFTQCVCAFAEDGVNVKVMKADGVSVVVLTPEETLSQAVEILRNAQAAAPEGSADFTLPQFLTLIGEEAFAGIDAEVIEISENVVSIGRRAFADCRNLREIHIPAKVLKVDDLALEGCENVIMYGETGTEAQRFANDNSYRFVDPNAEPEPQEETPQQERKPVELPLVPRR